MLVWEGFSAPACTVLLVGCPLAFRLSQYILFNVMIFWNEKRASPQKKRLPTGVQTWRWSNEVLRWFFNSVPVDRQATSGKMTVERRLITKVHECAPLNDAQREAIGESTNKIMPFHERTPSVFSTRKIPLPCVFKQRKTNRKMFYWPGATVQTYPNQVQTLSTKKEVMVHVEIENLQTQEPDQSVRSKAPLENCRNLIITIKNKQG